MIEIKNVSKTYRKGTMLFPALQNVSFDVSGGDFYTIIGPSGSGKSTLLHTIGGLIHPDNGKVMFRGKDIYNMGSRELDQYRKVNIGFMFQQFHLMPYLTVYENIRLACYNSEQIGEIDDYLIKCQLKELKNKYPSELSVGEKQRTAFIRAIVSSPEILLADEPTGNLDPANSRILISLIEEFNKNNGTVMIVTHDPLFTGYANKTLYLEKGKIVSPWDPVSPPANVYLADNK